MTQCPAPWCQRQLGPGEDHPVHRALMEDPKFDPKKHVRKNADGTHDIFFGEKWPE